MNLIQCQERHPLPAKHWGERCPVCELHDAAKDVLDYIWRIVMTLISLIVVLVIIGVILLCVNRYIPLDPKIRLILNITVVAVVVLWLLSVFGLMSGLNMPITRIR